jgi:HAD superfamily hydrolase (TIGR01509 family)
MGATTTMVLEMCNNTRRTKGDAETGRHAEIKAVIFDCDGTLVESEFLSNEVLSTYVAEFGLEISAREATELFSGGQMANSLQVLEARLGCSLPETFVSEFRRRQAIALRERLQPIDGAHDLLARLTRPFCLASNAPLDKCKLNLEVTGLDRFFTTDRVFSAYQIGAWKPEPDLFLHAAESMNVDPAHCAVVEDSPVGVAAGRAAGMRVFAFDPGARHQWNFRGVTVIRTLRKMTEYL